MASYYSSWVANGTSSVTSAYRTRLDLTFNTGTSAQNYTDIIWSLYLENGNARFADTRTLGHVTINGIKVWDYPVTYTNASGSFNSSILLQAKDGTNKATGTLRVPHSSDGTKTIAYSTSFETVNKSLSFTAKSVMTSSGTIPLTTIPRYTSITGFSHTGTDRGAFTFSWSAADTVSEVQSSVNGGSWVSHGNPWGSSGSIWVGGLAAGTQYNVRIQVKRSDSGLWTTSGYLYPTTHAAAVAYTPTASSITRSSFSISFTTSNTISGFIYSINGGSSWSGWRSASGSAGSFSVTGASAGTTYNVIVRVYDAYHGTSSGNSGTRSVTTEAAASPNTPTISGATRNSFTINVTANKSFNGFVYNINDGAWSARQSGTSVAVSGRAPGTTHQVRVRVYDGVHTSSLSGQSAAVNAVTVAAAAPYTPTLVSRTGVRAEVQWSSTQTAINVQYRLNGGGWVSTGSNFSARSSGSFPVTGLVPGTTYAISTRVLDAVHTGTWSGASAGLNVTTYALPAVRGFDFNLNSSVTAQVTESVVTMDYHIYLDAYYNGAWRNITSSLNQGASATLSLSANQITVLENAHPNTNNIRMRFGVIVYWQGSNETQGTVYSSDFTGRIVNANPTLSGITYKDVHSNTDFVNWKGGEQKILRNVSPVLATLGTATAIKGSTLSYYVFNINGKSFTVNANGTKTQTGAIRDLGVINSATNEDIEVVVYDSRNNATSMRVTVSMLDYMAPQVLTIEAQRENNYEPPTTLVVSGRSYIVKRNGNDVNTYTAKYRMKEASASTWPQNYTNVPVIKGTENGDWQSYSISHPMGAFDTDTSYDIEFVFQDSLGIEYTQNAVLTKGIGLMTFLEDKIEVGAPTTFVKGATVDSADEGDSFTVNAPATFTSGITSNGGGNISPSTTAFNYANGILVDICAASLWNMVIVDVIGHGYNPSIPIHSIFQVYHYDTLGSLLAAKQINTGAELAAGKFLIEENRLKLWFPAGGPYLTYIIRAYGMSGVPYKVSISNRTEPSVAHKTTCQVHSNTRTDSGSNGNGRYIKFSDGTQICYQNKSTTVSSWLQVTLGAIIYYFQISTWTFPASFVEPPSVFNTGDINAAGPETHEAHSMTTTSAIMEDGSYGIQGTGVTSQYFAIGRWK